MFLTIYNSFPRSIAVMLLTLLAFVVVPFWPMDSVHAFKPTNALKVNPTDQTHESITDTALIEIDKEFFPGKDFSTSMIDAIQQIAQANVDVDLFSILSAEAHFDDETFDKGQTRLLNLLEQMKTALSKNNAKGARRALGQALHTLQDFYSHSNWVEHHATPNSDLGVPGSVIQGVASKEMHTCVDCSPCVDCVLNDDGTSLTTGYFAFVDVFAKPDGKCSHGGAADITRFRSGKGGINKDTSDCNASPHFQLHSLAQTVATEATKKFIREIKDVVSFPELCLLLGAGPTLAFAIDTTGSMGGIINSVKQQAIQIVDARLNTDDAPCLYVLAPFNDPGVGPITVTTDAAAFKSAINGLFASGGGDCPELSMTGMLQALGAAGKGDLFMFTDASSKDSNLARNVSDLATSKNVKIYPILFGSCSPVDPAYTRIANDSGGQLFFLSSSEAANITNLADFVVRSIAVTLLSIGDSLLGAPKTYLVPVDSTMTRVTFSVSGTTAVTLKRPNATTVQPTDAGVSVLSLSSGTVYSITNPAVGSWSITVNGSGTFSITVSGESPLDLFSFKFVETGGRPGHEGLFPITGFPLAGQPSTVYAKMTENVATAQFEFRSKTGTNLQTFSLIQEPNVSFLEFSGDVALPNAPFLVYVTGLDINGKAYQRLLPNTIKSQSLRIIAPAAKDLPRGQTTTYIFQVTNLGPADTFQFAGADDQGFLSSISPTTFTLNTNENKSVMVQLQPPSNSVPGSSDTLTVDVQSTGATEAHNFADLTSTVTDTCPPPSIICPANVTAVSAVACPPTINTAVTYPAPTASGNCGGVTVVCNPPSSSTFSVGTTTVTCTATDGAGNTATCSFTVTVFNGRLQDDSNPNNVALFNTVSGAYRLCCNGTVFTGVGTVSLRGCTFALSHTPSDRRLAISVDFATKKGFATLQFPPGVIKCTITDRDLTNDTSSCP